MHRAGVKRMEERKDVSISDTTLLDGIEITTSILIVHVSLLDLLGKLALALPCLLSTLQLQSVLVHRESHSLKIGKKRKG